MIFVRTVLFTGLLLFSLAGHAVPNPGTPADAYQPTKDIEVAIDGNVQVDSEFVILGQAAKISALDDGILQRVSKINLLKFPNGVDKVEIPSEYIQSRIREVLGYDLTAEFRMPTSVTFIRENPRISQETLKEKILEQARLRKKIPSGVDLKIRTVFTDQLPVVPQGANVVLEPGSRLARWHGLVNFRVFFTKNGQRVGHFHWVRADMRWYAKRWKAVREIGYHERLKAEDFRFTEVEIGPHTRQTLRITDTKKFSSFIRNARARRAIKVNSLLTQSMIEKKPDIKMGEEVDIVFRNSYGLKIRSTGKVMENSSIGSEVKAKLKGTRKVVSGKMVSKKTLEVQL